MSSGTSVKLLIRTAPRTPCGPVTMPTQTCGVASVTVFAAKSSVGSAAAGSSTRRLLGGFQPFLRPCLGPRLDRGFADRGLLDQSGVAEEARDALGWEGADAEPMLHPLGFE